MPFTPAKIPQSSGTPSTNTGDGDYGIFQPLRDLTKGFREQLEATPASALTKDNPALQQLYNVASSPAGQFIANTGEKAAGETGKFLLNQGAALTDTALKPFHDVLDKLKTVMPDQASTIDTLKTNLLSKLANESPNAAQKGIAETAPNEAGDSASTSIGKTLGGAANLAIGTGESMAATEGAGALGLGEKAANIVGDVAGAHAFVSGNEGRAANPLEVGTSVATGVVMRGLFNKLFGGGKAKVPEDLTLDKAMKAGLSEPDAQLLASASPEEKDAAKQYFKAGLDKFKDRSAPGAFKAASTELDDFYKAASDKVDELGQKVGQLKPTLTDKMASTQPLADALNKLDTKYNIGYSVDEGARDWGDIEGASATQKMYEKFVNLTQQPQVDARDLESLTSQIDRKIGVYANKGLTSGDPAMRALGDLKTALNEAIGQVSPEFADANQAFASAKGDLQTLKAAGDVKVGKDYIFNPEQIMRRSVSNNGAKASEALNTVQDLAEKLGIDAPQNLKVKANLADLAERLTGTRQTTSLGGITEKITDQTTKFAKKMAAKAVPGGEFAMGLQELVSGPKPVIESNTNKIIELISKQAPNLNNMQAKQSASALQLLAKNGLISAILGGLNAKPSSSNP